jgi:hypothetical protein
VKWAWPLSSITGDADMVMQLDQAELFGSMRKEKGGDIKARGRRPGGTGGAQSFHFQAIFSQKTKEK